MGRQWQTSHAGFGSKTVANKSGLDVEESTWSLEGGASAAKCEGQLALNSEAGGVAYSNY